MSVINSAVKKVANFRTLVKKTLVERDREIDLALTCLVAQEHLLLKGPPGVAKSLTADLIQDFVGGNSFKILLTPFTDRTEVFGPLDVRALDEGRYEFLTQGYAPEADVLVLDEIFKGSSAVLNTFLMLLNERKYKNGTRTLPANVRFCLGCSNEYPSAEERGQLSALFDRFAVRAEVEPVHGRAGRRRLLMESASAFRPAITEADRLTSDEFEALTRLPDQVSIPEAFYEAYENCLDELGRVGVKVSDRRSQKGTRIVRAWAALEGRPEAHVSDGAVLQHVLWADPGQIDAVREKVLESFAKKMASAEKLWTEAKSAFDAHNPKNQHSISECIQKIRDVIARLSDLGTGPETVGVRAKIKELSNFLAKENVLVLPD